MRAGRFATRARFVASGLLLAAGGGLMLVFSRWGSALFPAYRAFSKGLIRVQAAIAGVVPFALWDVSVAALVVAAAVLVVRHVRRREPILPLVSTACLVVSATAALFVGGWALNHYAPPLGRELGVETHAYAEQELVDATRHYLQEASVLAPQVPRDDDGALSRQDFFELARTAGASYEGLGERYAVFAGGSTAPVKALLLAGEPLLLSGHVGIFWSPTGEATVPLNCAVADQPFTMCHEAAHRLGIASEQEANFAAYLACSASDDVRFAYAGNLSAFGYCLNALWAQDSQTARQLLEEVVAVPELEQGVRLVMGDRAATQEWYARYEGPFEEVGQAVNDSYLKGFGQRDGVRSYGLVVDYLIAWHQLWDTRG